MDDGRREAGWQPGEAERALARLNGLSDTAAATGAPQPAFAAGFGSGRPVLCLALALVLLHTLPSIPLWHPDSPPQPASAAHFPSMVFFENSSASAAGEVTMHAHQARDAVHYSLAIAGWEQDSRSPPRCVHEEQKLANISRVIKRTAAQLGTHTLTAVYAGQFEYATRTCDAQRRVLSDPAYDGFFVRDDDGRFVTGGATQCDGAGALRVWDFRNGSAVAYHTREVAGYFARSPQGDGVDAVFFGEGDSFACQYNCSALNTCHTMPNASAWFAGAVAAWVGAAQIMAAVGKRAIINSENAFEGNNPLLWWEDRELGRHHCPLHEGTVARAMSAAPGGPTPFVRFYKDWLTPEVFSGGLAPAGEPPWVPGRAKSATARYCRNQVANAVEEGKRAGVHFIVAGTSAVSGWGTRQRREALEFSLAGFLVARSRSGQSSAAALRAGAGSSWDAGGDFFGFDHQFNELNLECNRTRWGDCSHRWSEVQAVYARDYGVPLDDAVELEYGRFFRRLANVNITFDCGHNRPSGAQYSWVVPPP
jgi:hypothetical protein